jgi:hypothetical protein
MLKNEITDKTYPPTKNYVSHNLPSNNSSSRQQFTNGEVHNWYKIVTGYSDKLVSYLIDSFNISEKQRVLDPFCGTGTTLVECMKKGINTVGIDANPSSFFAARVKTNWKIRSHRLLQLVDEIGRKEKTLLHRTSKYLNDPTYIYIQQSGMLSRGWISAEPLRKSIALKQAIHSLSTSPSYKNALLLALVAKVVGNASNVKFGPELYCGKPKDDFDIFASFVQHVKEMARDLDIVKDYAEASAKIINGDSRYCSQLVQRARFSIFNAVICSPPYPTEHDYTRNARLELAFLEMLPNKEALQKIKRGMIRSHTKGIYKGDMDGVLVKDRDDLREILSSLRRKIKNKSDGFAKLYPIVIQEYFGGMKRHLLDLKSVLAPGANCAYVVGDQSSYLREHIPTAEILSSIVRELGFKSIQIIPWRMRWSTSTSKEIQENILVFKMPDKGRKICLTK